MKYKTIALIMAAGIGNRLKIDQEHIPKQYLYINDKSLLTIILEKFLEHPQIDAVLTVINEQHKSFYEKTITNLTSSHLIYHFHKSSDLESNSFSLDPRLRREYEGKCGEYEGKRREYEGKCGEYEGKCGEYAPSRLSCESRNPEKTEKHIDPLVKPEDDEEKVNSKSHIISLLPPIFGGVTRQDSVRNGLNALKKYSPENVLIHDAARIFIKDQQISEIIAALENYQAVTLGTKITDSLRYMSETTTKAIARDNLFMVQTPQGFKYDLISKWHNKLKDKQFTDDISLAEQAGCNNIKIIESSIENFKLTNKSDLTLVKKLLTAV